MLYLKKKVDKMQLNSVDIILLLLYSPGYTDMVNEPINGRTKITKILFLFEKELAKKFKLDKLTGNEDIFNFTAWNFGPMSATIFKNLDFLKNIGFVESTLATSYNVTTEEINEFNHYYNDVDDNEEPITEYKSEQFCLTPKGIKFIEDKGKYRLLTDDQKKYLKEYKTKLNKASLRDILKYVYMTYPAYTEKSIIKDDILGEHND